MTPSNDGQAEGGERVAERKVKGVYLCVDKDGLTRGVQISIDVEYEDGGGHGYRIYGPKYCGQSSPVAKHRITARDIEEITRYFQQAGA